MKKDIVPSQLKNFLLYKTPNGHIEIEIFLHNETLWLNQAQIAELFDTHRTVITKHLKNSYAEDELQKEATCAFFAQVQKEGARNVTRQIEFYNLDAIISVGYRVNICPQKLVFILTIYLIFKHMNLNMVDHSQLIF